jgi:hypothetical protein
MTRHYCDWCGKQIYQSAPSIIPEVYQDMLRGEKVGDVHFKEDDWTGERGAFLKMEIDLCPACVHRITELGNAIRKEAHNDR